MSWTSILAKEKRKRPDKRKKNNNLKKAKYQNVNKREPSFCIYLSRGGASRPLVAVSYATEYS